MENAKNDWSPEEIKLKNAETRQDLFYRQEECKGGLSCLKSKQRISQRKEGRRISGREPWQNGNKAIWPPNIPIEPEMDSSKISEECSSSESGWTTYLASPDIEHDGYAENEEDDVDQHANIRQKGYKKRAQVEEEAADSDDSMASDASSGPSDQRCSYGYLGRNHGFSHAGSNNERTSVAKKLNQKEEKKKQIKGEKDKSGNKGNSGGRLKKL